MARARDLGIRIGTIEPGPWNAITDVAGVRVGHATIVEGDGPLEVGKGPVRTGVTVVMPHGGDVWHDPVFGAPHVLNGNGEMTGLEWAREAGMIGGAIAITNTHSVGVVRDALVAEGIRSQPPGAFYWSLPIVGETWDGMLNDTDGQHVRAEHLAAAIAAASSGPVAEGNVGGGTGMVCHEFKGGIGTASRRLPGDDGGWTVGVLVQANYGRRGLLRVDGVPVGLEIPVEEVPSPYSARVPVHLPGELPDGSAAAARARDGSIIIIVATDAPLLPHQCRRIAQRASLGLARAGGVGATTSGDLILAFSTGNLDLPQPETTSVPPGVSSVRMLVDKALDPVFEATVEATEEAIINALCSAETMTGRDGITAHALPHARLRDVMARYGRLRGDT
ncbi:MAG TPA: P1 family peptidase [Candidatus Limnocylindrales bacterium]|nr:P1 family peptidase [Candidatus Limnocylindrales bacterium]